MATKRSQAVPRWNGIMPVSRSKSQGNQLMIVVVVLVLLLVSAYFIRNEISGSSAFVDLDPGYSIYVSEQGDDNGTGDSRNPLRTIQRALTLADDSIYPKIRIEILGEQFAISGEGVNQDWFEPLVLDGNKQIAITALHSPSTVASSSKVLVYDPIDEIDGGLRLDVHDGALAISNLHFDMNMLDITLRGDSYAEIYNNIFSQDRKWFSDTRLKILTADSSAAATGQNEFYFRADPETGQFTGDYAIVATNTGDGGGQKVWQNTIWYPRVARGDGRLTLQVPFAFVGISSMGNYVGIVRNNFKMATSSVGDADSGRYLGIRSAGGEDIIAENNFRGFSGNFILAGYPIKSCEGGLCEGDESGETSIINNVK